MMIEKTLTSSQKLITASPDDKFFVIEFANKIGGKQRENNFAAEEFTYIRKYQNSSKIEISEHSTLIQGKNRFIMNYKSPTNENSVILLDLYDDEHDIQTMFKYYTLKSLDDIPKYEFNDTIKAYRVNKQIFISFSEIYSSPIENVRVVYIILPYHAKDIEDPNTLNTIYEEGPNFDEITIEGEFVEEERKSLFDLPSDDYNVYVKFLAKVIINQVEDRVSYPYVDVKESPVPPAPVESIAAKKFVKKIITDKVTYKIEKENKEHYVYQIEIITGKSTIEGNKHLNFTLEPYTVFPTYKNSTLIKVYHYYELNGQIVITFYSI